MVEDFIKNRGHHCLFLPKFQCELNANERVWREAKRCNRAYCNYAIAGLRKSLPDALDVVSLDLIRKFYRWIREYERAYMDGNNGVPETEYSVKVFKSHRRIQIGLNYLGEKVFYVPTHYIPARSPNKHGDGVGVSVFSLPFKNSRDTFSNVLVSFVKLHSFHEQVERKISIQDQYST